MSKVLGFLSKSLIYLFCSKKFDNNHIFCKFFTVFFLKQKIRSFLLSKVSESLRSLGTNERPFALLSCRLSAGYHGGCVGLLDPSVPNKDRRNSVYLKGQSSQYCHPFLPVLCLTVFRLFNTENNVLLIKAAKKDFKYIFLVIGNFKF